MSSGDAHAAIFVGEGSDFQPWVAVLLSACAIILCVANYLFLRTHELSRAQLNADRVIRILRARRTLTALKVPAPLHDTGTMLLKVGYTFVCYALLSAKSVVAVNCGLVFAIALVAANVVRILKWVFHPDSVFHRKHLLFRKSPTFIRIRLMFELVRRFVYFVLAYSFISYGIHRIEYSMYDGNPSAAIPLLIVHIQSNVAWMTSLGTPLLAPTDNLTVIIEVLRTGFVFVMLTLFINIVVNGIAYERKSNPAKRVRDNPAPDLDSMILTSSIRRVDVRAVIELVIQDHLSLKPSEIDENCDLVKDLGADSLEVVEIQVDLEKAFETGDIPDSKIGSKRTVGALIDLFFDELQKANRDEIVFP